MAFFPGPFLNACHGGVLYCHIRTGFLSKEKCLIVDLHDVAIQRAPGGERNAHLGSFGVQIADLLSDLGGSRRWPLGESRLAGCEDPQHCN